MKKKPGKPAAFRTLSSKEAKRIGGLLRVSPSEVKQIAGKNPANYVVGDRRHGMPQEALIGPAVIKTGHPSKKGKRVHVGLQQVKDGLQIVNAYKRAGYGISGVTRDGVVIVEPAGKPDSFSLDQLDRALSEVSSKS
jgi:hypothetical protein